ncbi:MAG TPA: M24 family metallopeptidase [Gaiellaceae bacterium]
MDVPAVRAALAELGLDAWLLFDFRGQNAIARELVGVGGGRKATRRWFVLIRRDAEPSVLESALEQGVVPPLPGSRAAYRGWRELEAWLRGALAGCARVAMEYSPAAAVPYVGRVDAGTVELVRSCGVEVVSSGDLVQLFEARWTPAQAALHETAAAGVLAAKDELFDHVRARLGSITETQALAFLGERLAARGLVSEHPSVVAVNDHAASPHFDTGPADDRTIGAGDVLLVDTWAKVGDEPDAVYADVTWMAYGGDEPPARLTQVWDAVRDARDAAVAFALEATAAGRPVHGYEVDRAGRAVIEERGFGDRFVHRLGHSLGREVHGNGVNMDDLETRDERLLVPGLGFTVEPGVYLPGELGVRSEVNVVVGEGGARVTTEPQRQLILLR